MNSQYLLVKETHPFEELLLLLGIHIISGRHKDAIEKNEKKYHGTQVFKNCL